MNNLKEGLFNALRFKAGKSKPSGGKQKKDGEIKISAPQKPQKGSVALDKARQAWVQKSTTAEKQLDDLKQRPLRDAATPENILKAAGQFADAETKDGYNKGVTVIEKEFTPALDRAEKDGKVLEVLHEKVNDEIIAFEKDAQKLGNSNGELGNYLNDVKSRLGNAKNAQQITACRRLLKPARRSSGPSPTRWGGRASISSGNCSKRSGWKSRRRMRKRPGHRRTRRRSTSVKS